MQAHFSAPSSERRKLMSAPLSSELRNKYQVSYKQSWASCHELGAYVFWPPCAISVLIFVFVQNVGPLRSHS
jgi:hypothetical protein